MICKPEDAHNYYCCSIKNQQCSGDKCMAWKTYYEEVKPKTGFLAPNTLRKTELGYCGLIK